MKVGTLITFLIAPPILPLNVQAKKKNYPVTMNARHFIRQHITKLFSMFFLCGVLCVGCASVSKEQGVKTFQQQYKEYQSYARSGHSALKAKEYVKAIDHFTKASEISPFEPSLYHYRGLAWYRSGNKEEAIEDFDKVIILDPRWSSTYMYRGLCRMKGGDYKEALRDYMKALNLKPDDARIHNNLAWLYATAEDEKFQDKAKALDHARKAAKQSKGKNPEILDTLAKAYYVNGKVKEAVETEKKALKLAPNNEEFLERLKEYETQTRD